MKTRMQIGLLVLGMALSMAGAEGRAQASPGAQSLQQRATAWQLRYNQALQLHLRGMASSGQARDLYAAALLWPGVADQASAPGPAGTAQDLLQTRPRAPSERVVWLQAAIKARPRDPLVARFEAGGCEGERIDCDPAAALAFLLREEPDNAEVQLLAFADAQRRHDRAAQARYWKAAVSASRYDDDDLALVRLLTDAVADLPVPPLESALTELIDPASAQGEAFDPRNAAMTNAMAIFATRALSPGITRTIRYCDKTSTKTDEARADECKAVFALMARDANSLLARSLALGMMARLTTGTPQVLAWQEQQRQLRWLMQRATRYLPGSSTLVPADLYMGWWLRDGEIVAMQRLMEAVGEPLAAPPGWQPEGFRQASG